jgi:hypothetical protein
MHAQPRAAHLAMGMTAGGEPTLPPPGCGCRGGEALGEREGDRGGDLASGGGIACGWNPGTASSWGGTPGRRGRKMCVGPVMGEPAVNSGAPGWPGGAPPAAAPAPFCWWGPAGMKTDGGRTPGTPGRSMGTPGSICCRPTAGAPATVTTGGSVRAGAGAAAGAAVGAGTQ